MFDLSKIVFYCAGFLLLLAFIALALGLAATSLEAAIGSLAIYIVYSFIV